MTDALPFPDLESILSALGALEPDAEAEVTRRRRVDPALDAEISLWERRLLPLALSTPAAEPSAGLWDRIEAMIEERSGDRSAEAGPPAEAAEWVQWGPGVTARVLGRDPGGAPARFLLRLAQGATFPADPRAHHEACFVLAGEIVADGVSFVPGDLVRTEAGRSRPPLRSPGGSMIYILIGRVMPIDR